MAALKLFQNNYGRWVFSVVDDDGSTVDVGNQHATAPEARAESMAWLAAHPEYSNRVSVFVDGETSAAAAGLMRAPAIDPAAEAVAAGLASAIDPAVPAPPRPGPPPPSPPVPPPPAPPHPGPPPEPGPVPPGPGLPPDAGVSEQGPVFEEPGGPLLAQRRRVEQAMKDA